MKIEKFKSKQILKLHLLRSRVYEQTKKNNNFSVDTDLAQIITNFKRALQLIFQYHNAEKRILFVGVPKRLEFKINKLTNHVAVPNNFNLQGIFSNYSKNADSGKFFSKNHSSVSFRQLLPKLSKKPDLIVSLSHEKIETIASESYFLKIPLIVSDTDIKIEGFNGFYNLHGNGTNLTSLSNQNLLHLGLSFLFKARKKKVRSPKTFSSKFFKTSNSSFKSGKKQQKF